jgi:hypothetical protein
LQLPDDHNAATSTHEKFGIDGNGRDVAIFLNLHKSELLFAESFAAFVSDLSLGQAVVFFFRRSFFCCFSPMGVV